MMEIDRLKELQLQEDRDKYRQDQKKLGSIVIIDQIKEKELERIRYKEMQEKEKLMMLRQIKELEDEDKRDKEMKIKNAERMAKEVEFANKKAIDIKERRKLEEKLLELKIHQYVVEKARKDEEEVMEKKRVQEEKEREVSKLREKQEKVKDKQAELDTIKAKRVMEETERKTRKKEKEEIEIRGKKVEDLLIANEKAKLDKELKLAEVAKIDQQEYCKILEKQITDLENERRKEDEYKVKKLNHGGDIKKQMKEKEELVKVKKRDNVELGMKIKKRIK